MVVDVLATIPSPPQGVWHLGPLPLRGYAISILIGIIVGLVWARRRYAARGGDPDLILDVAIAVVPAGIIGGRLYHVATDYQKYFGPGGDPWQAFNIAGGGLGIWGAVLLGTLAGWAVVRWRGVPVAPVLDAVAPAIIIGQAIGRLGNWFNQELYGRPTDVPWGLEIYERVNDAGIFAPVTGHSTGTVLAVVHPTFLYELLWNLLVAAVLVWADRKFRLGGGRVFAGYVAGYTMGRFWIELMRSDPATLVFGLRINTITSTVVFLIAVFVLWRLRGRHREDPAYVRGDRDDDDPDCCGDSAAAAAHSEPAAHDVDTQHKDS
ncbi:prolipoprotein diacylglyceryl transferase [Corynebacterium sp. TAE3-ERU12]|uniref:prolipoprotein diacylglyceryl transferase n=1 Tax=Corynebacterium sp. TAE3-ERU12 TaxID=2849491 RepID=UPI001C47E033|nr:prolipoprotein diacylglyceryl transferase [Corynebacterium sp. TAE3-ERU12]MBV7296161.1 prolipoprotein diacylglyceryl transferase [Corynebacterium sp. TAE3-ERU12]